MVPKVSPLLLEVGPLPSKFLLAVQQHFRSLLGGCELHSQLRRILFGCSMRTQRLLVLALHLSHARIVFLGLLLVPQAFQARNVAFHGHPDVIHVLKGLHAQLFELAGYGVRHVIAQLVDLFEVLGMQLVKRLFGGLLVRQSAVQAFNVLLELVPLLDLGVLRVNYPLLEHPNAIRVSLPHLEKRAVVPTELLRAVGGRRSFRNTCLLHELQRLHGLLYVRKLGADVRDEKRASSVTKAIAE